MINIQNILEKVGLKPKEIAVYLACLEYGPIDMAELARRAGLKRPTVYNLIERLLRDNYLILIRRHRHTLYDAENPKKLLTQLRAQEKELETVLPELAKIRSQKQETPVVYMFETPESVTNIYRGLYNEINNKTESLFLTRVDDIQNTVPEILDEYVKKVTNGEKHKLREIVFDNEPGRKYAKELKRKAIKHPLRLIPTDFEIFNDLVIFPHKVFISSFKHRVTGTIFENKEIALTMKALFEWAWQNSKEN